MPVTCLKVTLDVLLSLTIVRVAVILDFLLIYSFIGMVALNEAIDDDSLSANRLALVFNVTPYASPSGD